MKRAKITIYLLAILAIAASTHAQDFTLTNNEHLDVTSDYHYGYLWDSSTANVTTGGSMSYAQANDEAILNISGGKVEELEASNNSTLNIYNGLVTDDIDAYHNTNVNIFGGSVDGLRTYDNSTVNMSGGSISEDGLQVWDASIVIFDGYDFTLDDGLSWDIDGQTILGTGTLSGTWFDNTSFAIPIDKHDITATIMAVPEPATLLLLTLGGLLLRRKNQV